MLESIQDNAWLTMAGAVKVALMKVAQVLNPFITVAGTENCISVTKIL